MSTLRSIDHLVLPVASLDISRERLQSLGFTVAETANHPFGTQNACIFLNDGTYLEPLAIASDEECKAAADGGNSFVSRHLLFCDTSGPDGFSAIVVNSDDAQDDHARFLNGGISGGDILQFSREMVLPDGRQGSGSFRLAFAASQDTPEFFMFACETLRPLPADRDDLQNHRNGATGLKAVALSAARPEHFMTFLNTVFEQPHVHEYKDIFCIHAANADIYVFDPVGMAEWSGELSPECGEALSAGAIIFETLDLSVTAGLLADNGISFLHRDEGIFVPPAPGQGTLFVFEESS